MNVHALPISPVRERDAILTAMEAVSDALAAAYQTALASAAEPPATDIVRRAQAALRARRLRAQLLGPKLFADPAWDILLDMLVSTAAGRRVSVSDACLAAGGPPTTALRYVRALEQAGLIIRTADTQDARRSFLNLTAVGDHRLRQVLAAA